MKFGRYRHPAFKGRRAIKADARTTARISPRDNAVTIGGDEPGPASIARL
jgi:hypothetical protein